MAVVDKFNKFARYYDNFFIQFFCSITHRRIIKFIKKYIENNFNILDIGCGTGNCLNKVAKLNNQLQLFGLDNSLEMIKIARNKFKKITFSSGNAEDLPFEDNLFNLIITTDAFYYFKKKERVISECSRVLKGNGYLFIFTPSIDQFLSRLLVNLSKISSIEKESQHLYLKDLIFLTESYGFKLIKKDLSNWPGLFGFKYWSLLFQKI